MSPQSSRDFVCRKKPSLYWKDDAEAEVKQGMVTDDLVCVGQEWRHFQRGDTCDAVVG